MKDYLLKYLSCCNCQNDFILQQELIEKNEIKEGALKCRGCQREYKIVNFIPRFVGTDDYADNFSFEWLRHRKTQLDSHTKNNESEKTFLAKTGFNLSELKGKLILDTGCGTGRFMEIALKYGAEVIGIDISYAIDAAYDNLKNNKAAYFIQADIFSLPFKPMVFDYIYSVGVLHHTPSTKKAFFELVPLLKQKGKIAIWIYDKHSLELKFMSKHYRKITAKLPKKLLYWLCILAIPYYYLTKIPLLGYFFSILLPISRDSNGKVRWLDTFDWYSPKYQWKHTYPEVFNWFNESGLKNIKLLNEPISIIGEK